MGKVSREMILFNVVPSAMQGSTGYQQVNICNKQAHKCHLVRISGAVMGDTQTDLSEGLCLRGLRDDSFS